jgi:tagaturonate reductase
MKNISETIKKEHGGLPEKVLQIGEGNFLRAFVDWMIEKMNSAGVFGGSAVLCQPIARGLADKINAQNGIYTVLMRGVEGGKVVERTDVVTSVSRCLDPYTDYDAVLKVAVSPELQVIVSNTTEAGIAYHEGDRPDDRPPASYPAKLAALLYARYKAFGGEGRGLLILPVELIERNGDKLRELVYRYAREWELPQGFIKWLDNEVCFASTLVDRIVTGFPRDEIGDICNKLGYEDNILVTCEPFHTWVIEAPSKWKEVLPFDKAGLHVIWTDDMTPYRTRKVRILNGTHTTSVLAAYLGGCNIVLEMMRDEDFLKIIKYALANEIIPNIDLPLSELTGFADAVLERFSNPFIKHRLLDISLNSVSKYRARCLGSLKDSYKRTGELPKVLCFGLAALIEFYRGKEEGGKYYGVRGGDKYEIRDDPEVLRFFADAWSTGDTVHKVLANSSFWGEDLTALSGLEQMIGDYMAGIDEKGMKAAVRELAGRI